MRFARSILVALLAVALAAYAVDCSAMATPEQAMQCCKSMPCSSHGHRGQDCCKTMPAVHSPFVLPSSVHGVSFSPVLLAALPASVETHGLHSPARSIAAHCHAPPIPSSPALRPLRI